MYTNNLFDTIDLMLGDINVDNNEIAKTQAIKDFYLYDINN